METYELLQSKDFKHFSEVFDKAFGRVPDLSAMTAIVAKEGDEIVGFLGLYAITVVDSMWIKPELRGKGLWKKIFQFGLALPWKKGNGFHILAANGREEALCKKFGVLSSVVKVFKKVF